MQEVSASSFRIRVDRADGLTGEVDPVSVQYMVVEQGVYTEAEDGVKMEAVKFASTVTAENNSWVGESRSYANTYDNPVVLGQVMSCNDSDWSVFWSRGSGRTAPPSSDALYIGKHVGEDADTTRADETIGYIVIEAGSGTVGGVGYVAGLGADMVKGMDNSPPDSYSLAGLASASSAVVSQAAMDGSDGGWAVLYGDTPVTSGGLSLAIDEDQLSDTERGHTTEQVAYIVFGSESESSPAGSESLVVESENSAVESTHSDGWDALLVLGPMQPDLSFIPNVLSAAGPSDNARLTLTHHTDEIPSEPLASRLLFRDQAIDQVMADLGRPLQEQKRTTSDLDSVLDELSEDLLEELALIIAR